MNLIRFFLFAMVLLCAAVQNGAAQPSEPAPALPAAPADAAQSQKTESPAQPKAQFAQSGHRAAGPELLRRPSPPSSAGEGAYLGSARLLPKDEAKTAEVVRIALILTLMAILPAILLCMTSFVRIVVVLSMIRHGLGMPETPPNQVLVSLAIFLTLFSMLPTLSAVNDRALQPFLAGTLTISEAIDQGTGPTSDFMLRQVRDQDIKAIYDIAHKPLPARASDVGLMQLVPAFMLNELRVSFRIGFVILLPFVLIDLVVSSILLSLGMLMVPPTTLSLPIKVLMFVLVDGWSLVLQGVLGSFR
jgi:flagellar biosynthetic protein FliP